jgi:hypothetical protein
MIGARTGTLNLRAERCREAKKGHAWGQATAQASIVSKCKLIPICNQDFINNSFRLSIKPTTISGL